LVVLQGIAGQNLQRKQIKSSTINVDGPIFIGGLRETDWAEAQGSTSSGPASEAPR